MDQRTAPAAWVVVCLMALGATGARAAVLEIADDGAVTTYAAPMVYTDDGATVIQAPASLSADAGRASVRTALATAAARYALDPALLEAVAWQESRFSHRALSPKGAIGVMQLMPATARDLRVDPFDMTQNVLGGAAYLSQMLRRYNGDVGLSLAAYNAGPGAVDRYRAIPPYSETRNYVGAILARLGRKTP